MSGIPLGSWFVFTKVLRSTCCFLGFIFYSILYKCLFFCFVVLASYPVIDHLVCNVRVSIFRFLVLFIEVRDALNGTLHTRHSTLPLHFTLCTLYSPLYNSQAVFYSLCCTGYFAPAIRRLL